MEKKRRIDRKKKKEKSQKNKKTFAKNARSPIKKIVRTKEGRVTTPSSTEAPGSRNSLGGVP